MFEKYFSSMPLVAILRGLHPKNALEVGTTLVQSGFKLIEVPLNGLKATESIEILVKRFSDQALIGAGTVLSKKDVKAVTDLGGTFIVSPNCDLEVITYTKEKKLISLPGVATPSEAFSALKAGADGLKFFPADMIRPKAVKAMRDILPASARMIPVGGIDHLNMLAYIKAGANGFGFGSALFKPHDSIAMIRKNAEDLVQAYIDASS